MTKTFTRRLIAMPTLLLALGSGVAEAGSIVEERGVIVCVNDKWDEKKHQDGHKRVEYAGRCVKVPDDATATKTTEACSGQYDYKPDGSWTAQGACNVKGKDDDTMSVTWEEGSQLKDYTYKATGGTGKFKDAGGGGTYKYDQLTDTLFGGRYHSTWELP